MGWSLLSKPGTEHGPCEGECEHTDCAKTRSMAESECSICGEEIGYERGFYARDDERDVLNHAVCSWEKVESIKKV